MEFEKRNVYVSDDDKNLPMIPSRGYFKKNPQQFPYFRACPPKEEGTYKSLILKLEVEKQLKKTNAN